MKTTTQPLHTITIDEQCFQAIPTSYRNTTNTTQHTINIGNVPPIKVPPHSIMRNESTNNSRKWLKKVSSNPASVLGVLWQFMAISPQGKSGYV